MDIKFGGNVQVKRLLKKLWLLVYKRAELDLRSSKICVSCLNEVVSFFLAVNCFVGLVSVSLN